MGDSINARNRNAYNEFSGWQQQQQIDSWNQQAVQRGREAQARLQAQGDAIRRKGGGGTAATPPASRPTPSTAAPIYSQPAQSPLTHYNTNFNAEDQAVNSGSITQRMRDESRFAPPGVSGDGARAIQDQQRAQVANDVAQTRRGLEAQNAQQSMKDQLARSELIQSGLANQAKIYGDLAQRNVSQIGLASQLQQALINSRNAFMNALMEMRPS